MEVYSSGSTTDGDDDAIVNHEGVTARIVCGPLDHTLEATAGLRSGLGGANSYVVVNRPCKQ